MRKFFEKIVEGGLLISGSVTSLAILLIIVFLFKEASGLFNSPAVEEGYVLAVNSSNPVKHLSPEKTKQVFDSEITNWSELGGNDEEILVFRFSFAAICHAATPRQSRPVGTKSGMRPANPLVVDNERRLPQQNRPFAHFPLFRPAADG